VVSGGFWAISIKNPGALPWANKLTALHSGQHTSFCASIYPVASESLSTPLNTCNIFNQICSLQQKSIVVAVAVGFLYLQKTTKFA